jgi:hypothetical protein
VGGFSWWTKLPAEHCGEDVLAQLRVMQRHGGCGVLPSGAYHQQLPTTVEDRRCDAPRVLDARTLDYLDSAWEAQSLASQSGETS